MGHLFTNVYNFKLIMSKFIILNFIILNKLIKLNYITISKLEKYLSFVQFLYLNYLIQFYRFQEIYFIFVVMSHILRNYFKCYKF